MNQLALFMDSSALMAGVISATGAARVLLELGGEGALKLIISEQVAAETERNLARKVPAALPAFRQAVRQAGVRLVKDPPPELVRQAAGLVSHQADVPVLLAAIETRADYFVTLNRRHFIDDPRVAQAAGIRIGSPGDALAWVRDQLIERGAD